MNVPCPVPRDLSFADAIGLIEASDLPKAKKSAWSCSLRQIAAGLGTPPEGVVARWQVISSRVRKLHPLRIGMSAKTLANHKSNTKGALLFLTEKKGVLGRGTPLTLEWGALRKLVPRESARYYLTTMMRYASAIGVRPDAVDDNFVNRYMDYRRLVLAQDASPVVRRRIVVAWNECATENPSWPKQRLTPPPHADRGVIGWDAFPSNLRAEIDAWLDGMKKLRRTPNGSRRKPAKATTLRTRFAEIQAFARRAVALGEPIADLHSLSVLLDPDLVEKIIDDMCGDEPPKTSVIDLGWRLYYLAEATDCLQSDALARIKEIRDALNDRRATGMTQKNIEVVRAVMTGSCWKEVVALPRKIIEQASLDKKTAPTRAALRAQRAIGIAMLTFMPVRIGNLANIRIGVHLIRPNGLAGDYLLTIPSTEVKNKVDIECPFDADLSELIDIYIRDFRPHLMNGANHDFLFPGRMGDARSIASFSDRIAGTVEKAIGIRITAHQFRHAAAAVILRNDPGNYEFVRRILGHKSTKTTREFYIALDGIEAGRRFGEMLRGDAPDQQRKASHVALAEDR